jgi:uncharacterized cupredoxin-like copper-binding protein
MKRKPNMTRYQTTQNQPLIPALRRTALALFATAALAGTAHAHGPSGHGNTAKPAGHAAHHATPEQKPWGIAGEAKNARRTIEIRMTDNMRFAPSDITVKLGETVRLVAVNAGQVLHEIVIGTPEELKTHAELMKKHPNMEHDEPYMAHVDPGQRGEIVWTFNRPGNFEFACLIPGHFEAGMTGRILVQR